MNVRLGYSISSKYATAWVAWSHTQQHKDRNVPPGVCVPLYYKYYVNGQNYGHINVRLPNGTVWSDGAIYGSIADYEAKKAPDFVGWGESVNDVRVIEYVAEPAFKMPPVGSQIRLIPIQTRTTFRAGTATVAGNIHVTDNTYLYTVRGYDPKYKNRVIINSRTGGGDGVALALYYTSGVKIDGWVQA
jgi:hypothetical protein